MEDEAQDEDDLLSQQLHVNSQTMDPGASPIRHLSTLMGVHHPQMLAKFRLEQHSEAEIIQRSNLEVLQAAITNNFSTIFPPIYVSPPPPPLPPPALPQPSQNNHSQIAGSLGNQIGDNQALAASRPVSISQPNESPPPRCRNNGESQGNSRNNGEAREGESRAASVNNQHQSGTNWSFEEQFKQLYDLDGTPERKIFLDELFTFMQGRGTPISRLPIMAKSVLDLYELYKLVVLRGGLVEVINKKLWQEIIKGLRLPASITSAAFTLRTQYMKYLYPYEKDKEGLSTQEQLQTAIETNRRESRRNNYAAYPDNQVARNQHNSLQPNPLPLPLSMAAQIAAVANESQHHVNGHPHGPQHHPQHLPPNLSNLPPNQISDYMLRMLRDRNPISNNPMIQGGTPPPPPSMTEGFKSGLLWNMYSPGNNNMYPVTQPFSPSSSHSPLAPANSPEPQREALDLANSGNRCVGSPACGGELKRNQEAIELSSPTSSTKKFCPDVEGNNIVPALRIRQMVNTRDSARRRELEISVEIDGILYEGVLTVKQEVNSNGSTSSSPDNNGKRAQNNDS
ncbi:PREDICTED: AT-rich interactive domain-containing protein 3C-like isoform X2 [Trachymyrmex septentrionalis]|uniref:AT-rich interactive domain-containing protein 3C-like isoform X2 n=1 Tax=Trachymyrmex septentrionalis TaxID=34720 RepID=UPI00084F6B27|nr:PREDICTED: AT-rich interactive domain-containing protein 3C-like isoform X2 [Trachymyrmex septentrionalis]